MGKWLTTYVCLAAYLGLTADGIRRILKNEELLLHLVRCNAQEAGADWRKECAEYRARLRHPAGRGFVDVRMCFVKRWCAVLPWVAVRVTGQLFTGLPSAGFVWFWLFCYCMRAWVRL
ncbi:putative Fe2+ transport protein [Bifidobacterium ruminantium]|uniref:Putative Fe2+ transport protein n=1 Tax=Bifidobacterium ruminantium TaxID=78346 RepID=A0A087CS27_BIFRU|nr:putative Fe2+ transport protein [Bifidobacterium ruminantium]